MLFVGRQHEVALLLSHIEAAAASDTRVALVAGEPGIGKTRLLDVIAARAAQAGVPVLRGGASEAEGMPPYLPFLLALGQHIHTASSDTLRAQTGALAPVLATILPELPLRLGELPANYPLPPEQARMRLYEAVVSFLVAIAVPHGLLIILDDLQWADMATLDLLCYVARHQRSEENSRLLLVGAYREGEATNRGAFHSALVELNRLRVLSTISLGLLAEVEIAALAAAHLGAPLDPASNQFLYLQSEGNPFFAEELLRGWLESGALRRQQANWSLVEPLPATVLPTILSAVRQRLNRLSPEVVNLLRSAAIIGRTFELPLLAAVVRQEQEFVEEQLQEALQARLIRAEEADSYVFSHDKIRESLYEDVTSVRRRRLHELIGHAIEALSAPESAQRLADLAFHFARGGDRVRGAVYAQRAAEQAMHTYAPDEAMAHYRAALDLIAETDPRRGECLIGLGDAAILAGAQSEGIAAFQAAQGWFERKGEIGAAARAAHRLGKAWWQREAIPQAQAAFETARRLLAGQSLSDTVAVLVDVSSLLTLSLHQPAAGLVYARQALEIAERLEDTHAVAAASRALGNLLVRTNEISAGITLLETALELAVAIDDPAEAAECCACLRMASGWNGDFQRAAAYAHHEIVLAQRCHTPFMLRHVYAHLAVFHMFRGQWIEAEQMLAEAQLAVARLANPEALAYLDFVRGSVAWARGDYATAEHVLGKAIATFRSANPNTVVWYLGSLALVLALRNKGQEAGALMDEIEALIADLPISMPVGQALSYLVSSALILNDRERLSRLYPRLAAFRGRWLDRSIDRLLGEIETLQGNVAAAEASLAAAEAIVRREGITWDLPPLLVAQANLALARGGRGSGARARALLAEAQSILGAIGNQAEARRLEERMWRLPARPGARRQARFPAALSQREVEVLRLVAAGKTNREIASALHLSEYTVAHHLTSIFNKAEVDNRAAAAAFAIRHGLE